MSVVFRSSIGRLHKITQSNCTNQWYFASVIVSVYCFKGSICNDNEVGLAQNITRSSIDKNHL